MDTPKNLQDLLKLAIKLEGNGEKESIKVDEDKKQFLDCVLQSMSANVMEELLYAIEVLQNDVSNDQEKSDALNLIRDYIDNIDFANSFVKLEGADILIDCIKSGNKLVCVDAIMAVAEMSQNNIFCQQYFLKYDIVELLIKYLNNDNPEIIASALYALSSIIRNYEPAMIEFKKYDGLNNVINCLNIESTRAFTRACILIESISSLSPPIKDEFAKLEVFSKLLKKLRVVNDYEYEVEIILKAMSVLIESPYCKPSENEKEDVVHILENIISENENLSECEEIVSLSRSILSDI